MNNIMFENTETEKQKIRVVLWMKEEIIMKRWMFKIKRDDEIFACKRDRDLLKIGGNETMKWQRVFV